MKIVFLFFITIILLSCEKIKNSEEITLKNNIQNLDLVELSSKGFLECEESLFYAGDVKIGQVIEHSFKFKNNSNETVLILEKTMSCNCTQLKTSLDTIQPNQSTILNVTIDTKDKSLGKNIATITVKTNGTRRFYLLEVNYNIIY